MAKTPLAERILRLNSPFGIRRRLRRLPLPDLARPLAKALARFRRDETPQRRRVVLVLFNTQARDGRFWGNMQISRLAGDLEHMGIDNEMVVLLMRPGEEARNEQTIEEFFELMGRWEPTHVVFWANWLPWLMERLREETGARVMSLDPADPGDVVEGLRGMSTQGAVLATVAGARNQIEAVAVLPQTDQNMGFRPKFKYRFVGNDEPITQPLAFVSLDSCPYDARIQDNPLYRDLDLGPEVSSRGCSYCNAGRKYMRLSEEDKRGRLAHQIRYLQEHVDGLEEIAVPFPEDYLQGLAYVLRNEVGLKPMVISGQFNAGSLVADEAALDDLLSAADESEFEFHVNVVGLESFVDEDCNLFNRSSEAEVREAVAVLRRMRAAHDPARFMPETVGSLILFHPWQTVAHLRHNLDAMRGEGIEGLFTSINLNDMRFHPGVAMYHLARRDGLLTPPQRQDMHDIPLGGYFAESPWIFQHADTANVHRLFSPLKDHTSERIGVLEACTRLIERDPELQPDPEAVVSGLTRVARMVRSQTLPRRGRSAMIRIGAARNTGYKLDLYSGCHYPDDLESALAELDALENLHETRVTIGGPEPTMVEWLPELVAAAKERGAAQVEVLTYGRMLAYPKTVAQLLAAGVDQVTVLLHAADARGHDEAVRVPGAFRQAVSGLRQIAGLHAAGKPIRAAIAPVVSSANRAELPKLAELAKKIAATEFRLVVPMAELDLDDLKTTAAELELAIQRATELGLEAGYDGELSLLWPAEAEDNS